MSAIPIRRRPFELLVHGPALFEIGAQGNDGLSEQMYQVSAAEFLGVS